MLKKETAKYNLVPGYHWALIWLCWAVRKGFVTEEYAVTLFSDKFLLKHVDN